jgi:RNA polymerase sigma-70 factor (ECF subfamily)
MQSKISQLLAENIKPEWTLRVVQPDPTAARETAQSEALGALDDRGLVSACLAGDRAAFDLIVERHQRTVYRVCYRFVGNHEDASDLAQDVFIRAYKGLPRFKGQSALGTWLYRIAVNVALNRKSATRPRTEPLDARPHTDDRAVDPTAEMLRSEEGERVRAAIAQLPARQRATVILRVYHELSHQEIAGVLGSSVGAVKANFFHALGNLKKLLK